MFSKRTRWICASCVGVACCLFILYQFFPPLFSVLLEYSPLAICTTLFLGVLLRLVRRRVPRRQNVSDDLADTNSSLNISSVAYDLSARNDERSNGSATKSLEVRSIALGDSIHNAAVKVEEFKVNQVDATFVSSSSSVNGESSGKKTIKDGGEFTEKSAEALFKVCKDDDSGENYATIIEKVNFLLDHTDDSCLSSPSYHMDHKDASSDSGSDVFNLAAANLVPVIDELDPLVSRDSIDDGWAASVESNASDGSSADEEEIENQLDDEDDEEEQEDKDENKLPITWTADDQRNVVELGNSEIERNRCLENVIATRKAKKIMEKDLIDLDDDNDVQLLQSHSQLAYVNVPRRNPFDFPDDSDESVPGSAPSVLVLSRRNPFDLPFEHVDNFIHDSTPQEVAAVSQRDAYTRRHESFSFGSVLELRQEKRASRFKPYFIPEKDALEEMAFPALLRESSEVSDSKMSSTSDSDTGSSSTYREHENDLHQDSDSSPKEDAEPIGKESQTMDFKHVDIKRFWSQENLYGHETHHDDETDDASQESVLNTSISDGERAKELDETYGGYSEGSTVVSDADHDEENNRDKITTSEATPKLGQQTHGGSSKGLAEGSVAKHAKQEQSMLAKQKYGGSSKGSNPEHVEEEHALPGEQRHGGLSKSSAAGSDTVEEEDHSHGSHSVEPVYDSSPTASERSNPNAAQDEAFHTSDREGDSPPPALTEKNASSGDPRIRQSMTSADSTAWVAPPSMASVEKNESVTEEVSVINELDVIGDEVSKGHEDFTPEAEAVPMVVESNVSSLDAKPGEGS